MTRIRSSLNAFLKDESGVILAEALMLIPILIWAFVALIVYWDLFRVMNSSQKASYSIADLMSRQGVVTENFVSGTQNILEFLVPGAEDARMLITSIELDEGSDIKPEFDGDDAYVLLFSRSPDDSVQPHTTSTIQDLASRIPDMNDLESVVIVETWVDYAPAFDTGMLDVAPGFAGETFHQFIVTRPRNQRRVCLAGEIPGCV